MTMGSCVLTASEHTQSGGICSHQELARLPQLLLLQRWRRQQQHGLQACHLCSSQALLLLAPLKKPQEWLRRMTMMQTMRSG